jgi:hypothetical protein
MNKESTQMTDTSAVVISYSENHLFHNKPRPDQKQSLQRQGAYTKFVAVTKSIDDLVAHLTSGKTITPAVFRENRRGKKNFIRAQIIGLDFDEGENIDVGSLAGVEIEGYKPFLVMPTPSSTDEKPRTSRLPDKVCRVAMNEAYS